jgi:hypothetical protein
MIIFIGKKTKPYYMIDIAKNKLFVFQPDKYSLKDKEADFIEKYSLGKNILECSFKKIIFIKDKPVDFIKDGYKHEIVSDIIVQTNKEYILINKHITYLQTL